MDMRRKVMPLLSTVHNREARKGWGSSLRGGCWLPAASVPAPRVGNAEPLLLPFLPRSYIYKARLTTAKHGYICFVSVLLTRFFLPSSKAATLKGFSQTHTRGGKTWDWAMFCLAHTLWPAASFSLLWWDGDIFPSSSSIKDHLRERPSPALNKTLRCLSAVLLSHLCSSAQYFRFLLLCWFCFLTQTSRLKNRLVVTSHRVVDLLRQQGSFRAARKQMKPTPFYFLPLKETF